MNDDSLLKPAHELVIKRGREVRDILGRFGPSIELAAAVVGLSEALDILDDGNHKLAREILEKEEAA